MASGASLTSVGQSATNVTIIAADADRNGLLVTNTSTGAALFLRLCGQATAAATTTTAHSLRLSTSGGQVDLGAYRGIVTGIWASTGSGAANVTELY